MRWPITVIRFELPFNSSLNGPKICQNNGAAVSPLLNDNNSTEGKLSLSEKKGPDWIEVTLPIFTASEANGGVKISFKRNGKTCYKNEHWSDKHRRHKHQKTMVFIFLQKYQNFFLLPCYITLTRYAPRKLDQADNLPMSLKYILDAICAVVTGDYRPGRADSSELIDVSYAQEFSKEYFVKIFIKFSKKIN